jgi:hypothetical protein
MRRDEGLFHGSFRLDSLGSALLPWARLSSAQLGSARLATAQNGTEKTLLRLLLRNRESVFRCYSSCME